jgi:hypothetical protein
MMTVLLGVAALTVDVGALYNTKAELQRTADAAALAAASVLADWSDGDPGSRARSEAISYVQRNNVLGRAMDLDPNTDVVFGRATYDVDANSYDFVPTENLPDAVMIRVRHTASSPNGAIPLYFARIFGMSHTEMTAEAIAVMVPRDIAIVADLSGSHNDDSQLTAYRTTDINLYDVWDAFPGGAGDVGGTWNADDYPPEWEMPDGSVPQAAGPAWGFMKVLGYGTDPVTSSYNPANDAGLIRLTYNQSWNSATLTTYLRNLGYNQREVNAIMSNSYDGNGYWDERVAVALGLAWWNSGLPPDSGTNEPGFWAKRGAPAGNNNNQIGGSELQWVERINGRTVATSRTMWTNYINFMKNKSALTSANSSFQYRFGVKTFMHYMMENYLSNSQVPELAQTPHQPMQAVKDAVTFMIDMIDELDTDDQVSLEIYGTTARHEVDLTHNHQLISERLHVMQAGHYDTWTNMGGGLQKAIDELGSARSRATARKMIILLTDGIANVTASGQTGNTSGGHAYAVEKATEAAALGYRVFAVSVGSGADTSSMQQIADIGGGEHFYAEGSIEEYSEALAEIFRRLGGERPVELIR